MIARVGTFLLAFGASLLAQQSALQQAESAYRQRQYETALNGFSAALAEAKEPSGALLYDLGNCAFRLGRHAQAALFYRRALVRLPRDPEVRFNLRLAEQRLGVDARADESLAGSLRALRDAVTPGELLALALVLQGAGAIGVVLLRRRRGLCNVMVVVSVLGVLCWARLAQLQWFPASPSGVLQHRASLRSEPDASQPTAQLEAGELVDVTEERGAWLLVTHARGNGWTERESVGLVD